MVLVHLELFQLVDTANLLNYYRELIIPIIVLEVLLTGLQDVFDALHGHNQRLGIIHVQHARQRRKCLFLDHLLQLLGESILCSVAQGPNCFFLHINVIKLQNVDQFIKQTNFQGHLNLVAVAGRDIGHGPANFLAHSFLLVGYQAVHRC